MSDSLELYNPLSCCSKCGASDADTEWSGNCVSYSTGQSLPEYMQRTCRRCGYEWYEAPLTLENEEGSNLATEEEATVTSITDLAIDCGASVKPHPLHAETTLITFTLDELKEFVVRTQKENSGE